MGEPHVKKALKILVGLLIGLVLLVGIAWMSIDGIAASAVRQGGTYVLGVPVDVKSMSIGVFSGQIGLDGLQIDNPEGFDEPRLMATGQFAMAIEGGSIFSDTIKVPVIELDGLDVWYIKKGDTDNVKAILANLERFKSGEAPADEAPSEGKKFLVDRLTISNVTLHLDVPVLGKKTVRVPKIELEGLTKDNAQGLAMGELIGRVFPAMLASVFSVDEVANLIPDLAKGLMNQLGSVDELAAQLGSSAGEAAKAVLEGAGKALEGVTEGGTEAVGNLAEGAGKAIEEGVGGALEGIFGGKKKDDDNK
jgi:hypothetical protein